MATRYQEIAADIRRRIAAHEWGPAGTRIPTLAVLMDEYDVSGVQTVRNAQALLVDEGVLETRHGSGVFIASVPRAEVAVQDVSAQLAIATQALHAAQAQLDAITADSAGEVVEGKPAENHEDESAQREWAHARWTRCATCGAESGVSRGWVSDDDAGGGQSTCDEDGHAVTSGPGLRPERSFTEALAVEEWWEASAYEQYAAELLLAGDIRLARAYAQRARTLAEVHDHFSLWSFDVSPRYASQ